MAAVIPDLPDLRQTTVHDSLPAGGRAWCGPTAAGNVVWWLGRHGHPRLLNGSQGEVVEALGRCMQTHSTRGTRPEQLVNGLQTYFQDCGVSSFRLDYEGPAVMPPPFGNLAMRPRLSSLQKVPTSGQRFALLNVGWYKDDGGGRYRRTTGHWVTLAGISEREGIPVLIVHDPSPRGGGRNYVTVRPMEGGTLRGMDGGLERAGGFYALRGLKPGRSGGDRCVLEGVVYLDMGRRSSTFATVP